jgi:hypothetical protein
MGARWSADPAATPTTTPGENDAAKYKEPISQATADDVHQKQNVFSKDTLEFLFGMSSESGEGSDEIVITNHKAVKVKYKIEAAPSLQCVITANPATGSIAPGKEKKVKLKADVKDKVNLSFKLTVHVGTEAHFLNVRVRSLTGVFGTDPTTLDMVEDEDLMVPEVLVLMKKSLIAADGLKTEGIFRLAGDVFEIAALKDQMNKKTFEKSDNVNTVATLIKVWYRELPEPILNKVPTSSIYYSTDSDRCIEAYRDLAEPYKTLLTWLLDLLCMTTQHSAVNRMTPQNLAIVVAPNLYDTSSSDPMEGLVMSQKVVQFVNNILLWYLEKKTGSVPTHAPAAAIPIRNPDSPDAANQPSTAVNSLLLSSQAPQRPKSPAKRRLTRNQTDGSDRAASAVRSASGDLSTGSTDPNSISNRKSPGSPRSVKRQKSGKDGSSSSISVSSPRRQTNAVPPLSASSPEVGRSDSPSIASDSTASQSTAPSMPESPKPFSTLSGPQSPHAAPGTPASDSTTSIISETPDSVSAASSAASLNTSTLSNASPTPATLSPSPSLTQSTDAVAMSSPSRQPPPLPTTPVPAHFRNHSLSTLPPPATSPATSPLPRAAAGSVSAHSPRGQRLMSPRTASFSISRPAPPTAPFPGSAPATPSSPRASNGTTPASTPRTQAQANETSEPVVSPSPKASSDLTRSPRNGNPLHNNDEEASPRLIDDSTAQDDDDLPPPRLSQLPPPSPAMTH